MQVLRIKCDEDRRLVTSGILQKKHSEAWPNLMFHNFSVRLHTLDLQCHCTDWFLGIIAKNRLFPHLKHVNMQRSVDVTDRGLEWLSQHTAAEDGGIETIDISFCGQTTYKGTFCIRDRLSKSLKVLRRQPKWLDGKFHTPFSENSETVEVHTYYADGAFSFNRDNQSRGFVSELQEWDPSGDYLADKLQYTNFEPLLGWPTWTTYSYRPGVCLLKLPDHKHENGELIRSVLVGQNLRGLRPPKIGDLMRETASDLAIGTSTYFQQEDDEIIRVETRPPSGGMMISKMRVYSLDSLMPPDDLVQDCRTACDVMRELGDDVVDSGENYLNEALS